jgi:hypothetical protein
MLDDSFAQILVSNRQNWRAVVEAFMRHGIPALCLASSINYFGAFRTERLPANLIQAQRDFFGAHTYQRLTKRGPFTRRIGINRLDLSPKHAHSSAACSLGMHGLSGHFFSAVILPWIGIPSKQNRQ